MKAVISQFLNAIDNFINNLEQWFGSLSLKPEGLEKKLIDGKWSHLFPIYSASRTRQNRDNGLYVAIPLFLNTKFFEI